MTHFYWFSFFGVHHKFKTTTTRTEIQNNFPKNLILNNNLFCYDYLGENNVNDIFWIDTKTADISNTTNIEMMGNKNWLGMAISLI